MPPGGSCCSVACCSNYSEKGKRSEAQEKLIFHTFPRDTKLRKEWIRRCYRKGNFIPLRICSKHFKPSDYEDEMQGRLMGFVPRKLKKDAIPTLHLRPQTPPRSPKKDSRTVRYQARRNKLVVESLIEEPRSEEVEEPLTNDEVENIDFNESSQQRVTKLEEENKALKEKIKEYESNELSLKEKLDEMQLRLEKATQNISDQAQILFKDFLSPNQAKLALKKLSKVRWTQEDLSRAFTIRYLSKRCYQYLRNTLHYPLPGLSTLHRWAANINLRTGHLNQIINIMAITRQTKGPLWGMTMLAFDEVKICSMYEFDQAADEIVGPHQYMQVVMARGIIENWKQPVYIAFDQKITKEILFEIIEKLHDAKYDVVGIVSDCGGSNMGLWNELSITTEKTSFTHPKSTRNIYVFADVPHLLKLVRNWFLDKGFVLKSGKVINKSPVEELICGTGTEISSLFKLTAAHINCVGTQRQNVALAAQLFSRSTATALKRYLPGSDAALARDVGDFIQLINDWFDIMNSYSKSFLNPIKS